MDVICGAICCVSRPVSSLKDVLNYHRHNDDVVVHTGYGGGWGYSGHSIEAVRFSADTDLLLGGFGLFGGRGEYFGKIRVCFMFF